MTRWSRSKLRLPPWISAYADLLRLRLAAARYRLPDKTESRVYRRLRDASISDRLFYILRRRRRDRSIEQCSQPSQLSQRLQTKHRRHRHRQRLAAVTLWAGLGGALWTGLFVNERITLGGVPYRIIKTFWNDETARTAYFSGDAQALHNQLAALGVEESIKAFYRNEFDNEYELDRHIHQIMFDRTGYVGEAYEVNNRGQLY